MVSMESCENFACDYSCTEPDFQSDSCGQKSSSKSFQIRRHSETEISVTAVEFTAVLIKKYSISGSPLYIDLQLY